MKGRNRKRDENANDNEMIKREKVKQGWNGDSR